MVETNTHPRKFVVRGPNEPEQPFDGQVWIDTSGNNVEMNQYNGATPAWELVIARGPDTPEYPLDGSLWTDTNAKEVKQYTGTSWTAAVKQGVTQQDDAQTFTESDLTLTHSSTEVNAGYVKLNETTGNGTGRGADTYSGSRSAGEKYGAKINPNTNLSTLYLGASEMTDGITKGLITDTSGTEIARVDAGSSDGAYFRDVNLSSGTPYYVFLFNPDGSFTIGKNGSASTPYSGTDLDITAGVYGGTNENTDQVWGVNPVQVITGSATTGSATVGWPNPTDIFAWDTGTFEAVEDTETADVYVEENDGTGWTEVAGPISRGHDFSIPASSELRYRVDLSRSDVTNNPRIQAMYRRWQV